MPELAMDAPSLKDTAARLYRDWLVAWINDPKRARLDAHMRACSTAARPARSTPAPPTWPPTSRASPPRPPPPPSRPPTRRPVRAGGRALRRTPAPRATCARRQGGRRRGPGAVAARGVEVHAAGPAAVPVEASSALRVDADAQLQAERGRGGALAAYLASFKPNPIALPPDAPAGDAANGRKLVQSSGCLNCHAGADPASTLAAPPLAAIGVDGWTRGCMSPNPAGHKTAPQFALDEQRHRAARLRRDRPHVPRPRRRRVLRPAVRHDGAGRAPRRATPTRPALTTTFGDETQALYKAFIGDEGAPTRPPRARRNTSRPTSGPCRS